MLEVTREIPVVENIRDNPIALASVGVTFTQASEKNIKDMVREIQEYKAKVEALEEEVRYYRGDKANILNSEQ
jgi:hypothetical protein